MKKIIVLLCFTLLAFNTSVSFASDGTKTTKDCVIDNLEVVEASVVISEFNFTSEEVFVETKYRLISVDYTCTLFAVNFSNRITPDLSNKCRDVDRQKIESLVYKTLTGTYNYVNKSNRCRMLLLS